MEILTSPKFQLIKQDIKIIKKDIFEENNINDWDKLLIVYNFCLFLNHLYLSYILIDELANDKSNNNSSFVIQFKNIYILFFILCNLKNSYGYLIYNISKINAKVAYSLFNNTKEYFC